MVRSMMEEGGAKDEKPGKIERRKWVFLPRFSALQNSSSQNPECSQKNPPERTNLLKMNRLPLFCCLFLLLILLFFLVLSSSKGSKPSSVFCDQRLRLTLRTFASCSQIRMENISADGPGLNCFWILGLHGILGLDEPGFKISGLERLGFCSLNAGLCCWALAILLGLNGYGWAVLLSTGLSFWATPNSLGWIEGRALHAHGLQQIWTGLLRACWASELGFCMLVDTGFRVSGDLVDCRLGCA